MENTTSSKPKNRWISKFSSSDQGVLLLALIVLCGIFFVLSPVFLSSVNIMNVLRQASLIAIAGTGIVLIILLGEIDLSIGSVQAVAGVFTVYLLNQSGSISVAIIGGLLAGGLIGLINGLLVTKAKVNSLIATLGTMAILRGVALVVTDAVSIQAEKMEFMDIGTGYIGPFPIPVIIAIAVVGTFYYVLNHTIYGRNIYAVGGNVNAAKLSGLNVDRIKITAFVIGGVLASVSAIILASRLSSGQPNAGVGFELEVIAAVILGGISLTGGIGTISGAIIGILILSVLTNGLVLLNVSSFYQDIARGVVIILAVYLDGKRKESLAKKILRQ